MEQIEKTDESLIDEDIAESWYKISHGHYKPSEQITRNYEKPFDKFMRFGKTPKKGQREEPRVKRIMTWINDEPITVVSRRQADFMRRTKPFVGQNKKPEHLCEDVTYGQKNDKDKFDASDTFRDFVLKDDEVDFWWQCVQDLNNFRWKIRRQDPEVSFLDVESDLCCLDKDHTEILPENEVFEIFEKHHIFPNKQFLIPLMDMLQLRKSGNVNYRKLFNLLNWKLELVLPKIKQAPVENTKYISTYAGSIGNIQTIDCEIRTAGLPSAKTDVLITTLPRAGLYPDTENLGDQTSVRALLSPNIFTDYGLTHIDFFKARSKEEIRDIFENIGFEFPENSFDVLWQKGLEMDCTDGVSVETFRQLLVSSNQIVEECICE